MTRITKQIAKEVALKLTEKKRTSVKDLQQQISEMAYKMAIKKVPKAVMEMYADNRYKRFIETASSVHLSGNGFNHDYISTKDFPHSSSNALVIQPESDAAALIGKQLAIRHKAEKEYRELVTETENTLLSLATYQKVEKQFPEAAKFLPANQVSTALVVNISSLRNRLK